VERAKLAYQAARKVEIRDRILTPSLLDEDWYLRKVSSHVSNDDQCFTEIFNAINKYNTETSILICGFDDKEANIYLLSDPGIQDSVTPEGFGIIGIGEDAARSRLFKLGTNPSDEVGKVLYDAYDAKESSAELLPDVGSSWDAMVLAHGKDPAEVPTDIKDLIEQLYKRHPRSPYCKSKRQPVNWGERLDEWSENLLG
jgi:hypothetical protein